MCVQVENVGAEKLQSIFLGERMDAYDTCLRIV